MIVRQDLSPEQQAVQSIHAAIEVARSGHVSPTAPHPHVAWCGVDEEPALLRYCERLEHRGIPFSRLTEPDRNNGLTDIATAPVNGEARKIFRKLKLVIG